MIIGDTMLLLAAVFLGCGHHHGKSQSFVQNSGQPVYCSTSLSCPQLLLPLGAVLLGQTEITKATPLILGCIAYQIIWVAFITYLAWFWLIRNYPASKLSAFLFLTPLFGVLEGVVLLDEQITYRLLTALAMVCASASTS
jgi:drug/metabolite transporter (DMT)-like permease